METYKKIKGAQLTLLFFFLFLLFLLLIFSMRIEVRISQISAKELMNNISQNEFGQFRNQLLLFNL